MAQEAFREIIARFASSLSSSSGITTKQQVEGATRDCPEEHLVGLRCGPIWWSV